MAHDAYTEGSAAIRKGNAFVNSEAKLTRDIGIAIANSLMQGKKKVLDGTAATGIRGIRYSKEADADVTFLEINESAYSELKENLNANGVNAIAYNKSFQEFANTAKEKFDVIDLDPFGGITALAYDAMKLAKDKTLLFATVTDTAVLCGAHYNACIRLYNAMPMHDDISKEAGIRILAGYIARIASQFNFGIECHAYMVYKHYMRLYLMLRHGAAYAAKAAKSLGIMAHCRKCGNIEFWKGISSNAKCSVCNSEMALAGPLWLGSMKNNSTIEKAMHYAELHFDAKTVKMLESMHDEFDVPKCYPLPAFTRRMKIGSVSPSAVIEALKNKGFEASAAHYDAECIKTAAPFDALIDAIKSARNGNLASGR